jgi:hypothetical protein
MKCFGAGVSKAEGDANSSETVIEIVTQESDDGIVGSESHDNNGDSEEYDPSFDMRFDSKVETSAREYVDDISLFMTNGDDLVPSEEGTMDEKNDHWPGPSIIVQSQEQMSNSLPADNFFASPHAWSFISAFGAALVAVMIIGALIIVKRRRNVTYDTVDQSSKKKRVAIDYGCGDEDDCYFEELSVISNMSSLSGGTYTVRQPYLVINHVKKQEPNQNSKPTPGPQMIPKSEWQYDFAPS